MLSLCLLLTSYFAHSYYYISQQNVELLSDLYEAFIATASTAVGAQVPLFTFLAEVLLFGV